MRIEISLMLLLTMSCLAWASSAGRSSADGGVSPVPEASRQLVLVLTSGPEATTGRLARFERADADGPWKPVGSTWPIVVGKTGLAAGLGLHRERVSGLPAKQEGDGKSPAGVFALTRAFGFAAEPPTRGGLPYLRLTPTIECVDDPGSAHYADLVDRDAVEHPDWSSSERMREIEDYLWGVVVAHNPERLESEGSCIFLHAWSGPTSPTVGCTAMELEHIHELVAWLRADAAPVMAQLTEIAFEDLREAWRLPMPAP